jgi:hypothetical protein
MSIYLLYILFAVLLLFLSILAFQPCNDFLKKINRKIKHKVVSKKYENHFRITISLLWWGFGIIILNKIFQSSDNSRFYISIIFILAIYFLNKIEVSLMMVLISPIELVSKFFNKINKKNNDNKNRFNKRISQVSRFKESTIILYSFILISFSFDYILTKWNIIAFALLILIVAIYYLLKSLYDIFRSQKDLLYISDKLDSFQRIIDGDNFIKDSIKVIISSVEFFTKYYVEDKTNNSSLNKIVAWSKKHLKKLQYLSKVGFSVFKTYLVVKLIFIVLSTLLFFVIVNANYFLRLQHLNIISSDIVSFPQFSLLSFYSFIGQPLDKINLLSSVDFLSLYILSIGIFGWIIAVIYILLFIDILTTSLSDFYETSNRAIKKLVSEVLLYLENISTEQKNKNNDAIIKNIKGMNITDNKDVDKVIDEINKLK